MGQGVRSGVRAASVSAAIALTSRNERRRSIHQCACVRDPSLRGRRPRPLSSIAMQFDETPTISHISRLPLAVNLSDSPCHAREVHGLCICAMQTHHPFRGAFCMQNANAPCNLQIAENHCKMQNAKTNSISSRPPKNQAKTAIKKLLYFVVDKQQIKE